MSYTDFDFPHTHFYDTDLRELICKVTKILKTVDELEGWKTQHEAEYQELKQLYDDLMAGNYPDSFKQSLINWIDKYGVDIIAQKIKTVHFGLTNDGYFCAFIPQSWSDIHFDTVSNPDDPLYGHLMLMYD